MRSNKESAHPRTFHSKKFQTHITDLSRHRSALPGIGDDACRLGWCALTPGFLFFHQGALMHLSSLPNVCPLCLSKQVISRNWGRKAGGAIGCAAGAACGFYGSLRGAQIGIASGMLAGPGGSAIGGIAGAVLGALAGTAVGCEIGTNVGKQLDERMLDNYECLDCGHAFSSPHRPNSDYLPQ